MSSDQFVRLVLYEVCGTEKAMLVSRYQKGVNHVTQRKLAIWIPKSQVTIVRREQVSAFGSWTKCTLDVPLWLARQKRLV